jgi:hypothetical protein
MSLDVEAFSENVRQYCQWVESSEHDLQSARQLLLVLLQGIPYLTVPDETDKPEQDYPSRDHAQWESDHNRLADLPLQYYRQVFAPCDLDEEPPVTGDLRDDLADIYGDLWHGLNALNAGDAAYAVEYWMDSYFQHWGHHASAAVYAMDEYYRKTRNAESETSS